MVPPRALAVLICACVGAGAAHASVASAQAPPPQRSITALGTSLQAVTPSERRNNASIASAIASARAAGVAPALESARQRATLLAQSSGQALGGILAIDETAGGPPFFFNGPGGTDGSFGPGQFCGTVPRFVIRRDERGRVRRVRRGERRTCRYPRTLETRLAVTYALQ